MFAQPWAWLGLAGLAVPVVIHLLTRHHATRARVPTVRFIDPAEVTFVSVRRLTDLPLLFVRAALIAVAVAAMAGPRWPGSAAPSRGRAMAVVIDTSQGAAGDEGRAAAREVATAAAVSVVVESASLPAGIASASQWLTHQSGARELVVVSDFQRGAVAAADFAPVPSGAAITLSPLRRVPVPFPDGFELRGDWSRMSWSAVAPRTTRPLTAVAGPAQARADAMLVTVAALVAQSSASATARHAVLVFPQAIERASVLAAPAINQPWMFDVLQPVLADARLSATVTARAWNGSLALVIDAEPDSDTAAAVAATVLTTLVQPLAWSEFEPERIAPEQLRQWERPATDEPSTTTEPQGRWLWFAVLTLLALEWWMRREQRPAQPVEVTRVA